MPRDSSERNVIGSDPMEHYKNTISKLLLGKEGSFPTGVTKQTEIVIAQYNCKAGEDSLPLFMEEIRGLTKCNMERLKHALHEVFTILNDDVDEIIGYILALSEFRSEKLPSNHGSGSYEDGIIPPSAKKQKTVTVSTVDAYEEFHGHINSDIFAQLTRDIRLIEESGETRQVAVKKFSNGLRLKVFNMAAVMKYPLINNILHSFFMSSTSKDSSETFFQLDKMVQGVYDLLDTVASKCRSMSTAEKLELSKRIRKLPQEALDHMVEVVKMRRPEISGSNKVTFNLGRLDDTTLWRLYFYVGTALKAKQDWLITPPKMFHAQ